MSKTGGMALAALALSMGGAARAQEAPKCHLAQIGSMPVVFKRNKPLVEVEINGKKALMLADTGASRTILFKQPIEAMGLHPVGTDVVFEGIGGARGALQLTLARFGLGGANVDNLRLYVLDSSAGEAVGILGADLLSQTTVEFDLAGGTIRLFDEQNCAKANLAYWSKAPAVADMDGPEEFHLPVQLNGVTVHAELDSGSQLTVATSAAAGRVGGVRQVLGSGVSMGGLGEKRVAATTMTFSTLKIGDEEIKGAKLQVGDYFAAAREETGYESHIKVSASDATEMLIGADFLHSHRLIVSHKQRRIYFTYVGGPVFQVVSSDDAKAATTTEATPKP